MKLTKLEKFLQDNPSMPFWQIASQLCRTEAGIERASNSLEAKRHKHIQSFVKYLNGKSDVYHPVHGRLVVCFPVDSFSMAPCGCGIYWSQGADTKAIAAERLTDGNGHQIFSWDKQF